MIEVQLLNKRTEVLICLSLPICVEKLREVIPNKDDFFIKRVRLNCKIQVKANDDIYLFNDALIKFVVLSEQDKNKVLALNSLYTFAESLMLKDCFELLEDVHTKEEYGKYVALKEVKLSPRFMRYINFNKYGDEVLRTCDECYFTRYGVVRKCK